MAKKNTDVVRALTRHPVTKKVEANVTGLVFKEEVDFEEWDVLGRMIVGMRDSTQWWIGDWLNYGDNHYGEKYAQAVDETNYSVQTLMNIASVCRKIPYYKRRHELSYSHHAVTARLEEDERAEVLDVAIREELSVRELRDLVKRYLGLQSGEGEGDGGEPGDAPDPVEEWERAEAEVSRLLELVESLQEGDLEKELAELHRKYRSLDATHQQTLTTLKEAEREAMYGKRKLKTVRELLGVERDRDIDKAIRKLKE